MAIGFMSFGGMLTGGGDEEEEKPATEASIKKEEVKPATKEIVAVNTNTNQE